MKPRSAKTKIGYLVKTFPEISEPFLVREIFALQNENVDVQIFALRRPEASHNLAATAPMHGPIVYLPASFFAQPLALLWAQLLMFLCHPLAYLGALSFIATRREAGRCKDFLQAAHLGLQLMRGRIQHLHVRSIDEPAGVAELASMLTGLPLSITAHNRTIYQMPRAELARKMASADFVVTCNNRRQEFLRQLCSDRTRVVKIHHSLDADLYNAAGCAPDLNGVPLLLSVGRLREQQGFSCLLDACQLLKIGGQKFRCVIAGDGPLREELQRRIAEQGLQEMVALTGAPSADELIALCRRATLFVLPRQRSESVGRDAIPNVLAEAMATGLAVVTTPVGAIAELIDHMQSGILVSPEQAGALAAAIKQLLDQPNLRQQLASAARSRVCQLFSAQRNAAQLKGLFSGSTEAAPAGQPTMLSEAAVIRRADMVQ